MIYKKNHHSKALHRLYFSHQLRTHFPAHSLAVSDSLFPDGGSASEEEKLDPGAKTLPGGRLCAWTCFLHRLVTACLSFVVLRGVLEALSCALSFSLHNFLSKKCGVCFGCGEG